MTDATEIRYEPIQPTVGIDEFARLAHEVVQVCHECAEPAVFDDYDDVQVREVVGRPLCERASSPDRSRSPVG